MSPSVNRSKQQQQRQRQQQKQRQQMAAAAASRGLGRPLACQHGGSPTRREEGVLTQRLTAGAQERVPWLYMQVSRNGVFRWIGKCKMGRCA